MCCLFLVHGAHLELRRADFAGSWSVLTLRVAIDIKRFTSRIIVKEDR